MSGLTPNGLQSKSLTATARTDADAFVPNTNDGFDLRLTNFTPLGVQAAPRRLLRKTKTLVSLACPARGQTNPKPRTRMMRTKSPLSNLETETI